MKAVALLLLVAVVSLSTVPDGGYDPFRLTTLDPAPAVRGEAVDRSPLCASRVQRMYHFVHPRLLLRYFYSTSLFNSLRGFWRVPVLEVLDYGRGSDPRQAGLWRGRPGDGGDLLPASSSPSGGSMIFRLQIWGIS